jgi:hypothetical protein
MEVNAAEERNSDSPQSAKKPLRQTLLTLTANSVASVVEDPES